MSEELSTVSNTPPVPAAQSDYDCICAALMDTARGRWFLQEYARRNRSADTRLLLSAIERIGAAVCCKQAQQQSFRSDLLEMATAITRTRAEVAEIRPETAARTNGEGSPVPRPPPPRDVFAAAERIRDVTWAMRGHGFDPGTCDQLEELAASILSASALRDPTDRRASKLSEVLRYLEHRIDALLESCADGDTSVPEPNGDASASTSIAKARPENGFAHGHITANGGHNGAEAEPVSPPAGQIRFSEVPVATNGAAHIEIEGDTAARSEVSLTPPPEPSPDPAREPPESPISLQHHEDGAGTGDGTSPARPNLADVVPASTEAGPAAAMPVESPETGARSPDRFLPMIDLPGSRVPTISPDIQAAAAAQREVAARAFLAEMPGLNGARAGSTRPPAAVPIAARAAMPEPAEPPLPAVAAPPRGDPLAALKAMSDDELIALFS